EVFALEHLRDGELGGEADEAIKVEPVEPFGVVAHLGLLLVENLEDLGLVGFGVGVELLARERRSGVVAARGLADKAGAVADEEDDGVAQILEVLELADEHGVAQMQVWRGGIESGLDAEGLAALEGLFEALAQIDLTDDFDRTFTQVGQLLVN